MNKKYILFEVMSDIFKKRKHIYYLIGLESNTTAYDVVASYSTKTGRLSIKDPDSYMPDAKLLIDFMKIANKKYKEVNDEV